MKIFDFIKRKLNFKNYISLDSVDDILLSALINGEEIDRKKALSLPKVSSAVDFITGTIAMIPIKLYKEEFNKETKKRKVTEVDDDRVRLLNDDTKDTLTGVQFKRAIIEDYLLGKGGYAYIKKNRNKVVSIHYVEDDKVQISMNKDPINKNYDILVNDKTYHSYDFLKFLRNTKNGADGVGVTSQVSKAIETAFASLVYQYKQLKMGGNKRGFLKSENKLSEEAIKELKDAWKKLYSSDNEENAVVLNKGIDFKECSNSSTEMQLNESRKDLNAEIDNIFHIKDDYDGTLKEAILPIISEIECSLNRDLLLETEKKDFFFSFDLKEILKGTLKERFEAYKIAKETGWITLNEIRYLENYDEIEGLDVIAMNLGNVIYDIKTKEYYTPNTDSSKKLIKGGDKNEE